VAVDLGSQRGVTPDLLLQLKLLTETVLTRIQACRGSYGSACDRCLGTDSTAVFSRMLFSFSIHTSFASMSFTTCFPGSLPVM
jgi:hypothetical protein